MVAPANSQICRSPDQAKHPQRLPPGALAQRGRRSAMTGSIVFYFPADGGFRLTNQECAEVIRPPV